MGSPLSDVDAALLKKYDRPGPRYTSYPTAPLFQPTFSAQDFHNEIVATNPADATADLSLYVHLPFCDTLCYFCGCTMLVTRDRNRIDEYLRYLGKEVGRVASLIAPARRVTQFHWGGGTPTHLSPDQIRVTAATFRNAFRFADDAECSVEIDPRELEREHLQALREAGFNRMSMGIQDFDLQVQAAVNRIQPEGISRQVYLWARELGFTSINIDLMYGLPHQTRSSFERTIRTVIAYNPDRIAVFNYAHVPWLKPHQKLIHQEDLPTPEEKLALLKMTIELLTAEGYEYIGMDHFARPDDELSRARLTRTLYRNFQGYSTKAGADLYGFGMSSISSFKSIYAQNTKHLPDYYKALDAGGLATHVGYRMTPDDNLRQYVIMRLMCDLELDTADVERRFGIRFDDYFSDALPRLAPMEEDGLVEVLPDRIRIVGAGRLLLRNIAMCFDAYLDRMGKDRPIFSRTV